MIMAPIQIQGTRGFTQLRKADLDSRFPGLIDSVLAADASSPEPRRDSGLKEHTRL